MKSNVSLPALYAACAGRRVPRAFLKCSLWSLVFAGTLAGAETVARAEAARVFSEPLRALGSESTPAETAELETAVAAFAASKSNGPADWSALTSFLAAHPQSPFRASLLLNLGDEYYQNGYFSRALTAWYDSWTAGQRATDPTDKALADRAVAEWLKMLSRLGRLSDLQAGLADIGTRSFRGSTAVMIQTARESLWMFEHHPELTYRCGPHALERILLYTRPQEPKPLALVQSVSGTNGIPLCDVASLARKVGLDYRMAKRVGAAEIPLPAVVHWKVNHYAAVLKRQAGRYLVDDPTFGNGLLWITAYALDSESDGYFLIAGGSLPQGWAGVDKTEASNVWGRGYPGGYPPPPPPPPPPADPPDDGGPPDNGGGYGSGGGSGGGGSPGAGGPGDGGGSGGPPENAGDQPQNGSDPGDSPDDCGLAGWNVQLSVANLRVLDSPLGYDPPVGPRIYFNVHYNALASDQPAVFTFANLGHLWTCDWIGSLTFDTANAYYHSGQGGLEQFSGFDPASQTYQRSVVEADTLVKTSPTNYAMLRRDGSKLVFGLPDNPTAPTRIFLTQIVDPQGNAATLTYDSGFRLTGITDALGQNTTLSYGTGSSSLLIQKVTDPFGRFATFSYNAAGQLTNITDAVGMSSAFSYATNDVLQTLTTGYGITSFNLGTTANNNRFVQVTEPDGEQQRFEQGNGTTPGINFTEAAVPAGILAFNQYLDGRDTYYWDRKAMAEAPGDYPHARIYHFMHQDLNTRSTIMESVKRPLENRVWFNYQGQNNGGFYNYGMYGGAPSKVGVVQADGQTQLFQRNYNVLGHLTRAVDPLGRTVLYNYASNNIDLLDIWRVTGVGQTQRLAAYTWNSAHRPLTITDQAGQITTFTYNSRGQPLTMTNPRGEATTFTYNSSNYLAAIDGPLPGTSDTISLTYDAFGRIHTATGVDGYVLTVDADALNRPTKVTFPDGTFQQTTYNLLDPAVSRDRRGRLTTYSYNSLRQLVSMTDPLGRITRFTWCGCAGLTGLTDPLGRLTQWVRDLEGRVTSKVYPDGTREVFTYDSSGRLESTSDAKGQTKHYTYALDGRPLSIAYGGAQVPTPSVRFAYDPYFPRVVERVDGAGTTDFTYYPITGGPVPGAGQVLTVHGPLPNEMITYAYDQLGRVITRSINGVPQNTGYDAMGRVAGVTNVLGAFGYSYVGATKRLALMSFPNGQTTTFDYFPNSGDHRLKEIWNQAASVTLSKFDYTYDPQGYLLSWTQQHGASPARVLVAAYDLADRLTGATNSNPVDVYGYAYDVANNRLSEAINAAATAASYNALNELTALSTSAHPNQTYEWDAENRLAAINYPASGQRTELTYDGMNHFVRIVEKSAGVQTSDRRFVWCDQELCEERDATGVITKRFFMQGVSLVSGSQAQSYYYARDHLGSIAELTDASGALQADFAYDPWGRQTRLSGAQKPDFGFAGYYQHASSGLLLAPARAYDPALGRWLSRDPLPNAELLPEGPNLYAYVGNSPLTLTDPLGTCKRKWEWWDYLWPPNWQPILDDAMDEYNEALKKAGGGR
jgi:RHS repeat-associated protein